MAPVKKIGILFGMENTFPAALVERINGMSVPGLAAEFVQIGDVRMAEPCGYDVIIDRISHDIPFYRAWLKNCALCGSKIINNPFWWSADDKFFNYALATKLGVAIPPTAFGTKTYSEPKELRYLSPAEAEANYWRQQAETSITTKPAHSAALQEG